MRNLKTPPIHFMPSAYPLTEVSKGLYFVAISIDNNKLQPIKLIVE